MFRAKLTIPNDFLGSYRRLAKNAQDRMRTELQTTVKTVLDRDVRDFLGQEPGPVLHPFEFSTDKSRKAYFATNGFGAGIPYSRTGNLVQSWTVNVVATVTRMAVSILNKSKYAKYVYGLQATPGHINTGWQRDLPTALELLQERLIEQVSAAWARAVALSLRSRR